MLIPFVAVWLWIWVSVNVNPWLGLPTMYVLILAIVAFAYKVAERKTVQNKGRFDRFDEIFNSLYDAEVEAQKEEIRVKRRFS
jgi:hypothetical protein